MLELIQAKLSMLSSAGVTRDETIELLSRFVIERGLGQDLNNQLSIQIENLANEMPIPGPAIDDGDLVDPPSDVHDTISSSLDDEDFDSEYQRD